MGPTDQTMSQIGLSAYKNTDMPAGGGRGGPFPRVLQGARTRV